VKRRLLNLVAVVAVLALPAGRVAHCAGAAEPPPSKEAPAPPEDAADEKLPEWVYYGCYEDEAFTVLVVEVSIPGVGSRVNEMPLTRCKPEDDQPATIVGGKSGFGDGRSRDGKRGTFLSTSLWINYSPHPDIRFRFSTYWRADDGSGGNVSKKIVAPVGRASEHALDKGVTLSVSFRDPVKGKPRIERKPPREAQRDRARRPPDDGGANQR
jgi:hypothetical protein